MKRARLVLMLVLPAALVACSALLDEQARQCSADADCAALGFDGWTCDTQAHVCVKVQDIEPTAGSGGGGTPPTAGRSGADSSGSGGSQLGGGSGGSGAGNAGASGHAGTASGGSAGATAGTGGSGGSGPPPCVEAACSAANGSCSAGVCVIDCTEPSCVPHCPAGMPCRVDCGKNACKDGAVDCGKASSCDISCGEAACQGGVDCSGSSCSVSCSGTNSCSLSAIVCRAKSCDIDCAALQSCKVVQCKNTPQTCSVECGGVQSCGTLFETNAQKTEIVCTESGSCAAMIGICCNGGATCSGPFAPKCN